MICHLSSTACFVLVRRFLPFGVRVPCFPQRWVVPEGCRRFLALTLGPSGSGRKGQGLSVPSFSLLAHRLSGCVHTGSPLRWTAQTDVRVSTQKSGVGQGGG